jgi:hypothetical protein
MSCSMKVTTISNIQIFTIFQTAGKKHNLLSLPVITREIWNHGSNDSGRNLKHLQI